MKTKTIILMVVAVVCGLAASYMTSRLLADRNNTPQENLVPVVMTLKKVPMLTLVKNPEELFKVEMVAESPATAKGVKSLEELKGKRLNKTLNEATIVRADDLQRKEDAIIEIPTGQRAIAIRVTPESLAGGFILPGMRVDILCTLRQSEQPTTMVLLQNMLVLAIDQKGGRDDDQRTALGQTATFAATLEECQRLSLAQKEGELRLVLRTPEDKRLATQAPTRLGDLSMRLRNGSSSDGSDLTESGSDVQSPGVLGGLPKLPEQPPMPTPTPVAIEEKKEPEPEAKPVKTHTLTVQEGQFSQRFVFTQDEEANEWRGGTSSRGAEEEAPVRKNKGAAVKQEVKSNK